ncbi:hypothetical protein D4R87_00720 [bacterium]|nr:MAG: hypothetical protein D4R87_00720 [bacterium]
MTKNKVIIDVLNLLEKDVEEVSDEIRISEETLLGVITELKRRTLDLISVEERGNCISAQQKVDETTKPYYSERDRRFDENRSLISHLNLSDY